MITFLYVLACFFKLTYPVTFVVLILHSFDNKMKLGNNETFRGMHALSFEWHRRKPPFWGWENDNAKYNCWEGVSRQCVHRYSKYTAGRHSRQPAAFLCIVTFSDMWRSCLLSFKKGGRVGVTHKLLSSLSNLHPFPSIHLSLCTASRPYREQGPVKKSQAVVAGGVGVGAGRPSDWPGRLQLESSSVCLFQCTYSGCRLVLSQRALWKDRNVMLLLRHKLWWSLSAVAMLYLPSMTLPHHHHHLLLLLLLFYLSGETPGARRGVTAVSGMLGGRCSHFPGLHLHMRQNDTGTRISDTSGRTAQRKTDYHS